MPLEAYPVFITGLDETSPDGSTEYVSEGDDHLRGLKASLKQQFPNLGAAAVNATAAQLNQMVGTTITAFMKTLLDDADAAAARATLELGTAAVNNSATANTANTVALRDGSGNFAAGTITASLTGVATSCSRTLTAGAGLTGGGVLTADRTISMLTAERMTTANVLGVMTGMTAGAVGSISFLRPSSAAKASPNTLVSGWYYSDGANFLGGLAGGSWRSLAENNGSTGATLFVRYA